MGDSIKSDASQNKNIPKIVVQTCYEDRDFQLSAIRDIPAQDGHFLTLYPSKVQVIFSIDEPTNFIFSPHYQRTLPQNHAFVIYQPEEELKVQLRSSEETILIHLSIRLDKLHQLFNPHPGLKSAAIFDPKNAQHKFYEELEISGELHIVLKQLEQKIRIDPLNRLFFQAKSLEILSLLYAEKNTKSDYCPFLKNELTVRKIKDAKNILLENFRDPPTIPELAKSVQLNEFQLKAGFKEIYGQGPYSYLIAYKMEMARRLLTEQNLQVKQVAHEMGYSNISHFIEAFKKQFGITPKKLLLSK
ncbi:MAG: helix-turn-helix transcriptional regulator [Saprospiraceae bacterium]|nr:helix-turn-helix transcriptional regulator [Saprospiraceae bacterium]